MRNYVRMEKTQKTNNRRIVASSLYSNKNIQDIGNHTKIRLSRFHSPNIAKTFFFSTNALNSLRERSIWTGKLQVIIEQRLSMIKIPPYLHLYSQIK